MNDLTISIIAGILLLACLAAVLRAYLKPLPEPKQPQPIWHGMPPLNSDGLTPCCGVRPFDLPPQDMLSWDQAKVTCPKGRTISDEEFLAQSAVGMRPSLFRRNRGW